MSFPVKRLNHAVLYVRDLDRRSPSTGKRSVRGDRARRRHDGLPARRGIDNHHDLGLMAVGPMRPGRRAARPGCTTWRGRSATIEDLAAARPARSRTPGAGRRERPRRDQVALRRRTRRQRVRGHVDGAARPMGRVRAPARSCSRSTSTRESTLRRRRLDRPRARRPGPLTPESRLRNERRRQERRARATEDDPTGLPAPGHKRHDDRRRPCRGQQPARGRRSSGCQRQAGASTVWIAAETATAEQRAESPTRRAPLRGPARRPTVPAVAKQLVAAERHAVKDANTARPGQEEGDKPERPRGQAHEPPGCYHFSRTATTPEILPRPSSTTPFTMSPSSAWAARSRSGSSPGSSIRRIGARSRYDGCAEGRRHLRDRVPVRLTACQRTVPRGRG